MLGVVTRFRLEHTMRFILIFGLAAVLFGSLVTVLMTVFPLLGDTEVV